MNSLMPTQISEVILLKDTIPFRSTVCTVTFIKIAFYENQTKIKDTSKLIPLLNEIILRMDAKLDSCEDYVTKIEHVSNGYLKLHLYLSLFILFFLSQKFD